MQRKLIGGRGCGEAVRVGLIERAAEQRLKAAGRCGP